MFLTGKAARPCVILDAPARPSATMHPPPRGRVLLTEILLPRIARQGTVCAKTKQRISSKTLEAHGMPFRNLGVPPGAPRAPAYPWTLLMCPP